MRSNHRCPIPWRWNWKSKIGSRANFLRANFRTKSIKPKKHEFISPINCWLIDSKKFATQPSKLIPVKLYIKNMVCSRSKMIVEEEFQKLGIHPMMVNLGVVKLVEEVRLAQRMLLQANLKNSGLELLEIGKVSSSQELKIPVSKWSIIRVNFQNWIIPDL